MTVGSRIKALRLQNGLTLRELAVRVGATASTIRKWEEGEIRTLKASNLQKIADVLGTTTKSLEIIPEQARIVRMIFEMFANKSKKSEICQVLNDSGYTSSKGYPFSQGSLDSILSNKKYAGVYRYDDIEIAGDCPAIISEELFEQVQKERELRKRTIGVKHRKTEYLLSGKLYCGECGSLFSGTRGTSKNGQSYRYYTCPGRKICKTQNINASKLEDLVADETRMSLLTDENTYQNDFAWHADRFDN